ncbi:MAG: hypothetical protein ACREV3_09175 [Gammaproteobacteria bacterium]
MGVNFKEGGDATNAATNVAAGGSSDADAVGVGGAGILGSQGGSGFAFGGKADSSATNVNVQEGFADGTTDNVVASGNVGGTRT